jgi:hypothetical protein
MLKLIQANVTVIMYTGDADYNCNWLGGEAVSKEIHASGFSKAGMYPHLSAPPFVCPISNPNRLHQHHNI